jgi:hypothetical protein
MLVFTAIAAVGAVISYAFGQGGPVAGLIFGGILFIGVCVRVSEPLRERLRTLRS